MAKISAHKHPAIKTIGKGKACGKGWTEIEIKVGRQVRRACVRGKVTLPSVTRSLNWFVALDTLSHLLRH